MPMYTVTIGCIQRKKMAYNIVAPTRAAAIEEAKRYAENEDWDTIVEDRRHIHPKFTSILYTDEELRR